MGTQQLIFFAIFAVAAYFIITDESVAAAFYYVLKLIKSKFQRLRWLILNDPRNPIVKYFMYRRSMKLAKELKLKIDKKLSELQD